MGNVIQLVNINDSSFHRFGPYCKKVYEASTKGLPEFNAIAIPGSDSGKAGFSDRLRSLVENEWKCRKSVVSREVAYTGRSLANGTRIYSDSLYEEDLKSVMDSFDAILPNPTDPGFSEAIRSRTSGLVRAMQLLVKLHSMQKDSDLVRREADILGKVVVSNRIGSPVLPKDISIAARRVLMAERVTRLSEISDGIPQLLPANFECSKEICDKFSPEQLEVFQQLCKVYAANAPKFTTAQAVSAPEFLHAQWWYTLQRKLLHLDLRTVIVKMENLSRCLKSAKSPEEFMDAINTLDKK